MKHQTVKSMARRLFLKRLGVGGATLLPAGSLLAQSTTNMTTRLNAITNAATTAAAANAATAGDIAILRLLATAEIIETDMWQQYKELALGNTAFSQALQVLDGDQPSYVNQNTRDEVTHFEFLNAYLSSIGAQPVNLDQFRTLPSSQATGSNKSAKRLTNLMGITVDTSWFLRYRSSGNPDFGDTFGQIVNLVDVNTIPNTDLPVPTANTNAFQIQFIANAASFHFAFIEQGGSSLYQSFLPKVTSLEVLKIVGAIGGTEIQHFEVWQDKAGNAPEVKDNSGTVLFPTLPTAPAFPNPANGTDPSQPNDTNQIMPAPCKFIRTNLPLCSVIRPTSTQLAGAVSTFTQFNNSGLFKGQSQAFLNEIFSIAAAADAAVRSV